ncbi:hypothetical protein AWW66_25105 [Micromonospora rosaria]|uniref:Uncharacterized protein n=1 Tax=Micromonospora rosaria TaxID=47874 RepID=A0A136PLK8_9ACTN|nr:hypothetical protein AWW66_25105 [Micromonospora rosaria]
MTLTELSDGGYVLVELDTLTCHELLPLAGHLLVQGEARDDGPGVRDFLADAQRRGWIFSRTQEVRET